MASSSKTINMPLIFAVSIGATVSLIAIVMFGLAWYEYEYRLVLKDQVLSLPTHDDQYDQRLAEQEAHLEGIDQAIVEIAKEHGPAEDSGHNDGGHGEAGLQ